MDLVNLILAVAAGGEAFNGEASTKRRGFNASKPPPRKGSFNTKLQRMNQLCSMLCTNQPMRTQLDTAELT